jgi:hypothetical protein
MVMKLLNVPGKAPAVETAETYLARIPHGSTKRRLRDRKGEVGRPTSDLTVKAYVNHGRWVIDCPDPKCTGAEFLFEDQKHRCSQCDNRAVGGELYDVDLPKNRKAIEKALEVRPVGNRNWTNESVAQLRRENKEAGV